MRTQVFSVAVALTVLTLPSIASAVSAAPTTPGQGQMINCVVGPDGMATMSAVPQTPQTTVYPTNNPNTQTIGGTIGGDYLNSPAGTKMLIQSDQKIKPFVPSERAEIGGKYLNTPIDTQQLMKIDPRSNNLVQFTGFGN